MPPKNNENYKFLFNGVEVRHLDDNSILNLCTEAPKKNQSAPAKFSAKMIVDAKKYIEEIDTSSMDKLAKQMYNREMLLWQCYIYFTLMDEPPALYEAIGKELGIKTKEK